MRRRQNDEDAEDDGEEKPKKRAPRKKAAPKVGALYPPLSTRAGSVEADATSVE
jgi:hypothetical protein